MMEPTFFMDHCCYVKDRKLLSTNMARIEVPENFRMCPL